MPAMYTEYDKLAGNSTKATLHNGTTSLWAGTAYNVPGIGQAAIHQTVISYVLAERGGLGSAFPGLLLPTFLDEVEVVAVKSDDLGNATVKFVLNYKSYPVDEITVDGCLSQVDITKDKDGNAMEVAFKYPDYAPDPNTKGKTISQGVALPGDVRECIVTFKYTIPYDGMTPTIVTIVHFCQSMVGLVNSGSWILPGDPRTWKVEPPRARSRDGGFVYEIEVPFHWKSTTWDQTAYFVDPATGKIPRIQKPGTSGNTPGDFVTIVDTFGLKTFRTSPEGSLPSLTI